MTQVVNRSQFSVKLDPHKKKTTCFRDDNIIRIPLCKYFNFEFIEKKFFAFIRVRSRETCTSRMRLLTINKNLLCSIVHRVIASFEPFHVSSPVGDFVVHEISQADKALLWTDALFAFGQGAIPLRLHIEPCSSHFDLFQVATRHREASGQFGILEVIKNHFSRWV